jgi:hypothetical protein
VVQNVGAKRPIHYQEINVMEPGQEKWKSMYEFDTPVVRSTNLLSAYISCDEYLNVHADPHRQSGSPRNHCLVIKAHASFQRGRGAEDDGPSGIVIK